MDTFILILTFVVVFGCLGFGVYYRLSDDHYKRRAARDIHQMYKNQQNSSGSQSSFFYKQPEKTWKCLRCGHENSEKLSYCLSCRSDRSEQNEEKIICPHCGAMNSKANTFCFACRKSLTEAPTKEDNSKSIQSESEPIVLLKQLSELHKQGVLTDDEFEAKKKELLAKM